MRGIRTLVQFGLWPKSARGGDLKRGEALTAPAQPWVGRSIAVPNLDLAPRRIIRAEMTRWARCSCFCCIFSVKIEVHITGQISDNSAKISRLNQDKKRERVGAAARPKVWSS